MLYFNRNVGATLRRGGSFIAGPSRSADSEGYTGMLVRSFAAGAGSDDINLVLWDCGSNEPCRVTLIDHERRLLHGPTS